MKQPTIEEDGFALPGVDVRVRIKGIPASDREMLGRAVRDEWIKWAKDQASPKPSWLVPWEELSEPDREVDRRIGVRLANIGRCRYVDVGAPPPEPAKPRGGKETTSDNFVPLLDEPAIQDGLAYYPDGGVILAPPPEPPEPRGGKESKP